MKAKFKSTILLVFVSQAQKEVKEKQLKSRSKMYMRFS